MLRNRDWYNSNATRAYPLDDAATARDDAGREVPGQVLVDCRIRFPSALGRYACLAGLTVGPGIVTALFAATGTPARVPAGADPAPAGDFIPLAAVSVPRPVASYRHYPLQGLAPGVGGWAVFGRGVDEPYSGRLSTPAQGLLLPRCAAPYRQPPVGGLGRLFAGNPLTGVVTLLGGTDLEVARAVRTVDGVEVDAIVIRLADSLNRNVLALYAGPCGGRPESYTCPRPPLERINAVGPDCAGDLTLDFRGVRVAPFRDGGGLALDFSRGLAETCTEADRLPDATGRLPAEHTDDCQEAP